MILQHCMIKAYEKQIEIYESYMKEIFDLDRGEVSQGTIQLKGSKLSDGPGE